MFNYNAGGVGGEWRGKNRDCYNREVCGHIISQEASFKYWPDQHQNIEYGTFFIETTTEESLSNSVTKRVMKITHVETVRTLSMCPY